MSSSRYSIRCFNSSNSFLGTLDRRYWRIRTKARIILMFTSIAVLDLRTLDNITMPYSVNANGRYLILYPCPVFKVAICDLEIIASSLVSSNINSAGKRSILRRTCSLSRLVSTPYISAKSKSSITFCPLISYILFSIMVISSIFSFA